MIGPSPKEDLMSQRQLTLVFSSSNSKSATATDDAPLSSVRCKMLRADYPTPSRRKPDSRFIAKMRELEVTSPDHAAVLMTLADDILADRRKRGWPPLE